MKKVFAISLILILGITSCKNQEKKEPIDPQKTEASKNGNKSEEKQGLTELNAEVQDNIITCENKGYLIKIDSLKKGGIRLTSWNKPQRRTDAPSVVLYNGKIEPQGSGGGYHYNFKNKEYEYSVENRLMGETKDSIGIFLRVVKDGKQISLSKMHDLTEKKNHDKVGFTKDDLIGNWWTPHYAPRKIAFNNDDTFLFDEGDGKKMNGIYANKAETVTLIFSTGKEKKLTLGGGKDNASLTLTGEGENFVKER